MQPTLSKITIILIILVVLGGGVGLWYFLQLHPSSQTNTQTQQNGLPNVPQSSTGSYAQTQTPPDIVSAYGTLFQTLSAQNVAFTNVNASSTGAVASIYALYASDIAVSKKLNPSSTNFSLPVAFIDLNYDGTFEAFAYENFPSFCGSAGCPLALYIQKSGKWVQVLSALGGENIGISKNTTDGYADLFLSVAGSTTSQTNVMRYTWDGAEYQPQETVATWNGTAFTLAQ